MGILTDDDSLVDAALSEILALPPDQRLARDPDREVTYLLVQHHLGQVSPHRILEWKARSSASSNAGRCPASSIGVAKGCHS